MTAALATLNPGALVALASCEQRIERGLKTFIDVGQALAEIRDSRLYKGTHDTFESYLEGRWGMSRAHAYRMISAAEVVSPIGDIEGPKPTNEGQARALAAVPEPERAEVWREAVDRTDGKPTAKVVSEIAKERTAPPTPAPADTPSTVPACAGSPSPEKPNLRVVPEPTTGAAQELRADMARESERRAVSAGLRSVLTYLTSTAIQPADLARHYVIALADFTAEQLRFAAETMAAIAALKEQ